MSGVAVADPFHNRVAKRGVPYLVQPVEQEKDGAALKGSLQHLAQRDVHSPLLVISDEEAVHAAPSLPAPAVRNIGRGSDPGGSLPPREHWRRPPAARGSAAAPAARETHPAPWP